MAQFINSLLNYKFNKSFEPKFSQGRFSLVNKAFATIMVGVRQFNSNLELLTDFQVTGLKISTYQHDTITDYSGYNKKYIRDDGTYDPVVAFDDFSRHPMGRRLGKEDMLPMVQSFIATDSHEAFVYNMLVSWYTAKLYKDTKSTNNILKLKQTGFSDSHIKMNYYGEEDTVHEIELGSPNPDFEGNFSISFRSDQNYWQLPYVLRYTDGSKSQSAFYLAHVLGRGGQSGLSCDIPIAPLDTELLSLDPVGGDHLSVLEFGSIPWDKPEILWMWITDYVRLNRVEHAFASTLELLGALSSQPMPSYHESHIWQNMITKVVLAKFQPTRARVRSNLSGEPYLRDSLSHEVFIAESSHPNNFLLNSALMNYYFMVGLHAVVDNESRGMSDWKNVFIANTGQLSILNSEMGRAAMISAVTGKEVPSCLNNCAFVTYDLSPMYDNTKIIIDKTLEESYPKILNLEGVHPYVSGSLVLGTISGEIETIQHLKSTQSFILDDIISTGPVSAIGVANAYRLFGHDVTLKHDRSGELYPIYANVRDCVICPTSILDRTRFFDSIVLSSSTARLGRHVDLPYIQTLPLLGQVTLTITPPVIEAVEWQSRKTVLATNLSLPGRKKPVEFKVRAGYVFSEIKMNARMEKTPITQDFHPAIQNIHPRHPTESQVAVPTQIDKIGEQEDANSAE